MDLFRNIFAESSSESSDDSEDEDDPAKTTSSTSVQPPANQRKWQDLSAVASSALPAATSQHISAMATRDPTHDARDNTTIEQKHMSMSFHDQPYQQGARGRSSRDGSNHEGSRGARNDSNGQREYLHTPGGSEVLLARDPGPAFGPPLPEPATFGPSLPPGLFGLTL